jgi:hypothetical protein
VTPARIKKCLDELFLGGINHNIFQGAAYSPAAAPWPGWLFYASVDFGPTGGLWRDFPAITGYVARCQSFLQLGEADNDVLLYHPLPDLWMQDAAAEGHLQFLRVHNAGQWLHRQSVGAAAKFLLEQGYAFDYVSDSFLDAASASKAGVKIPGGVYRAVLVPRCRFIPATTMTALVKLAKSGATVLMQGPLPEDVPGQGNLEQRREELREALSALHFAESDQGGVRQAEVGEGTVLESKSVADLLSAARVRRERLADRGIAFVRRRNGEGHHYFLVNRGGQRFDGWLPLSVPAASAILFDCDTGLQGGAAARSVGAGVDVRVQLEPGQSLVVRTFANRKVDVAPWRYVGLTQDEHVLSGDWELHFLEGGPVVPPDATLAALRSWIELDNPDDKTFSGTARYTLRFDRPAADASDWLLDLGDVRVSARVKLNGKDLGILWHEPYRVSVGSALQAGINALEIEVTNLAANRIADYDRRKVPWKIFHDINFVNIDYKPFDASKWEPLPSGLLGPVKLIKCSGAGTPGG